MIRGFRDARAAINDWLSAIEAVANKEVHPGVLESETERVFEMPAVFLWGEVMR